MEGARGREEGKKGESTYTRMREPDSPQSCSIRLHWPSSTYSAAAHDDTQRPPADSAPPVGQVAHDSAAVHVAQDVSHAANVSACKMCNWTRKDDQVHGAHEL